MPRAERRHSIKGQPIAVGQRYGQLLAIEFVECVKREGVKRCRSLKLWRFRCDCGNSTVIPETFARSGNTTSCGCQRLRGMWKHGHAGERKLSAEYRSWSAMRQRCFNVKGVGYKDYGERGITVCDRWRHSFENFLADMGPRPSPKHSLDRFPNQNGDYEPGNCRWATASEQSRNKRNTKIVEFDGRRLCLIDACRKAKVDYTTVAKRLRDGWNLEEAVSAPKLGRWTYKVTEQMVDAAAAVLEDWCTPMGLTIHSLARAVLAAAVSAHDTKDVL
jgi:hypothetical protein